MKSSKLICPLCKDSVDKLVYRFHLDSERMVVERIKTEHPGWTEKDGTCGRCMDYYHIEIVMQQRILPEVGPHFPIKSLDDFIILPTSLRVDADPRFTGKGVTICFIDSGFYQHPDLNSRIKAVVDVTREESQPDSTVAGEAGWHGTMTSVVCAGNGFLSNGLYKGIASESDLVLIKVQDEQGKISTKYISKALEWILIHHREYNIRIINMSLAGDEDSSYTTSEIDLLAENLIAAGIVIVAAVGNDVRGCIKPPANAMHVIAVGGINDDNHLEPGAKTIYHSAYGATIDGLMKPELVAQAIWVAAPILPGTSEQEESAALHHVLNCSNQDLKQELLDLKSKIQVDASLFESNHIPSIREALVKRIQSCKFISPHYMHVDGTSFAAPIVSAVIAQLLEVNPKLDPTSIREILFSTARRLDGLPAEPQGFGVIQPRKAVLKALNKADMVHRYKSPTIDQSKKTISFYVRHDSASQISVAGTFNDWSRDILLMQPGFHGLWQIEIPILPAGKYHYKFFIDDTTWTEDVVNPYREPDGFNGFNSVLLVHSN